MQTQKIYNEWNFFWKKWTSDRVSKWPAGLINIPKLKNHPVNKIKPKTKPTNPDGEEANWK